MADVQVNISGNASQLKSELNSIQGSAAPRTDNNRMIEDVRRELQSRGVMIMPNSNEMNSLIKNYATATQAAIQQQTRSQFESQREEVRSRHSVDYGRVIDDYDQRRRAFESSVSGREMTQEEIMFRQDMDLQEKQSLKNIGNRYKPEYDEINAAEEEALKNSNEELTNAIKELTDYFNRASQTESYLGQLRNRREDLILEREQATTAGETMEANKKVQEVNEELRRLTGTDKQGKSGGGGFFSSMARVGGIFNMGTQIANGDFGGALVSGAALTGNPLVIGTAMALDAVNKVATKWATASETNSPLASLRGTVGGLRGAEARKTLTGDLPGLRSDGLGYTNLGMDQEQFSVEAYNRTRARGTTRDWYQQTMRQIGMERSMGLDQGALQTAGQYDRYGQNTTDALARLVDVLSKQAGSGVTQNDFSRVQEKFDIQQSLMASYMSRTDRPDYNVANRTLAAFSSTGVTQDARMGSDIQQFQQMIQKPINDRMKALVYSTIGDLFPETGGRMDLIDRKLQDPENEGRIMSAVVQRLTAQFGGTDTQMGYFAMKTLLPGIATDRRDEYVSNLSTGTGGQILRGKGTMGSTAGIGGYMQDAAGYQSEITKTTKKILDVVTNFGQRLVGSATPSKPAPKRGK